MPDGHSGATSTWRRGRQDPNTRLRIRTDLGICRDAGPVVRRHPDRDATLQLTLEECPQICHEVNHESLPGHEARLQPVVPITTRDPPGTQRNLGHRYQKWRACAGGPSAWRVSSGDRGVLLMSRRRRSPSTQDFHVAVSSRPPLLVLELSGELDVSTARCLPQPSRLPRRDVRSVLLDLSGLKFCDVAGLRALLALRHAHVSQGRHFAAIRIPPRVRRVMDLCGIDDSLTAGRRPPTYAR
jgi:anti-anti-sigma factor